MTELKFVIVNTMDRPSSDHVAEVMPDGKTCRYIHQRLRYWQPMGIDMATDIRDFGFQYHLENNGRTVQFYRVGNSKATYHDGTTRDWQEPETDDGFFLQTWQPERKETYV